MWRLQMSLVLTFCWQEFDHVTTAASREARNCLVLYWGEGKNGFGWTAAVSATAEIFKVLFVQ